MNLLPSEWHPADTKPQGLGRQAQRRLLAPAGPAVSLRERRASGATAVFALTIRPPKSRRLAPTIALSGRGIRAAEGEIIMRTRVLLRAAAFLLLSVLLATLPVRAQAPSAPPNPRREAPRPQSGTAQDIMTWLRHLTGTGNNHRRAAPPLPLPRPRPVELAPAANEPSKEPPELSPARIEQSEVPVQPAPASEETEKEMTSAPLND
jgi:hypothetical protein